MSKVTSMLRGESASAHRQSLDIIILQKIYESAFQGKGLISRTMRNHFRTRTLSKIVTENAPLPASALVESESQARAEPRKKIHLASPIIDAEMKAAAPALENEMMVMGESVF